MSKQTLCDGCRRDMTHDKDEFPKVYSPGNVTPVIAVLRWDFVDRKPGGNPDICRYCVIDAFKRLDNRVGLKATP